MQRGESAVKSFGYWVGALVFGIGALVFGALFLAAFVDAVNPGKLPEAASFNAPPGPDVDLFRGGMQLGVAVMVVPGRNNLNYPIALNYQAGIKVEQEASWVGLGWSFSPGAVTRDFVGMPDDYKPGFGLWGFRYRPNSAQIYSGGCDDDLSGYQEQIARWSEAQGWKSQSQIEVPGDKGGASDVDFSAGIPYTGLGITCSGDEQVSQEARGFLYTMSCAEDDSDECVSPDFWSVSGLGLNGRMFIEGKYDLRKDKGDSGKIFHMYNPQGRLIPGSQIAEGSKEDAIKIQYKPDGPNRVIDSFTFTLADGTRLVYDLPLYYTTKDGGDAGEAYGCEDEHVYKNVDKTGGDRKCELFLHRFAYTWLLTKIIDANGNTISFGYEKSKKPFRFRAPYGSDEGGALQTADDRLVNLNEPALHQSAKPAFLQFDDVAAEESAPGNAVGGWMETAYLKFIETDTHIAEMITSLRKDRVAYDDEDIKVLDGDGWFVGEPDAVKLDVINLYIKDGGKKGQLLSSVALSYDYSLQQGIPSFNPQVPGKENEIGAGKLTLKQIQQLPSGGGLLGDGSDPRPYIFEYGAGEGDNPGWEAGPDRVYDNIDYRYDYFGYFWKDGSSRNHIIADRYYDNEGSTSIPKYTAKKTDINHADAWSLNKVTWPTGATTQIEYESNKYSAIGQEPTIWTLTDGYVYRGVPGRLYDIDTGEGPATPAVGVSTLQANTCGGVNVPNLDLNNEQARGCFGVFLQKDNLPMSLTKTNKLLHYGGGVRVKKITMDDGDESTPEEVVRYFYRLDDPPFDEGKGGEKDEDGEPLNGKFSSGVLSKPYYNLLTGQVPMLLGYRRVIEELPNGGYVVHDFTSPYSDPPLKTDNPSQGWGEQFGKDYFWDPYDFYFDTSYLWGFEYQTSLVNSKGEVIAQNKKLQSFEEQKDELGKPFWEEILRPSSPGGTAKIYGTYPLWTRIDANENMQDGVSTSTRYYYNGRNGMPFLTIEGEELGKDARITFTRYSDEDEELTKAHILNKPIEQRFGVRLFDNAQMGHGDVLGGKNQIQSYASRTLMEYDEGGNPEVVKQVDPSGQEPERVGKLMYDEYGNLIQSVDAEGGWAKLKYWNDYLPEREWDERSWSSESKPVWKNRYDGLGRMVESCDANTVCNTYAYDGYSRLIRMIKPGDTQENPSVQIRYSVQDFPLSVVTKIKLTEQQEGEVVKFYDGLGRQIQQQLKTQGGEYIISETEYDVMHRPAKIYKPIQALTGGGFYRGGDADFLGYDYYADPLGRVYRTRPPGSGGLVYIENSYGNEQDSDDGLAYQTTLITDENKNTMMTKKNPFDEIVELKEPAVDTGEITEKSFVTKTHYDVLGRVVRQENALGHVSWNQYTAFNQPKQMFQPDAGLQEMKYDKKGNLLEKKTPKGGINYKYDVVNRLVKIEYPDGGGYSFFYDTTVEGSPTQCEHGKDKLCLVEGNFGKRAYDYDERGRIKQTVSEMSGKKYSMRYEYNSADNVVAFTNPAGVTTFYGYDDAGRVNGVAVDINSDALPDKTVASYTYNPTNTLQAIQFGNGVVTTYGYNVREWLQSISTAGVQPILQRHYEFDNTGNILALYNALGPENKLASFDYDKLYRLNAVKDGGYYGGDIAYSYDAAGDRKSMTTKDGTFVYLYGYETGIPDSLKLVAITGPKSSNFEYDAAGNMIKKNEKAFGYDVENRLECFGDYVYVYDSAGMRVKKIRYYGKDNALVTLYIHDAGNQLVFEDTFVTDAADDWKALLRCTA